MNNNRNTEHWNKLKEFIYIALSALIVAGLSLSGLNSENYDRAIWIGSFVFVFYYLYSASEKEFAMEVGDIIGVRIAKTLGFLFFVVLGSSLLSLIITSISRLDVCAGWAKSDIDCSIQDLRKSYSEEGKYAPRNDSYYSE